MKRSLLGKILERQQKLRPPPALGEWKHISASAAESTAEAAASASAADEVTQNQNSQDADAYEFDERSQDSLDVGSEAVEDQQVRPAAEQWLQVWHDRLAAKVEEEKEKRKKEFEQNSKKHWYSKMVKFKPA